MFIISKLQSIILNIFLKNKNLLSSSVPKMIAKMKMCSLKFQVKTFYNEKYFVEVFKFKLFLNKNAIKIKKFNILLKIFPELRMRRINFYSKNQ